MHLQSSPPHLLSSIHLLSSSLLCHLSPPFSSCFSVWLAFSLPNSLSLSRQQTIGKRLELNLSLITADGPHNMDRVTCGCLPLAATLVIFSSVYILHLYYIYLYTYTLPVYPFYIYGVTPTENK